MAISSIYIPLVEKHFNAQYVANTFNKNGIAKVSRVVIDSNNNKYNRVYAEIQEWHDTEAAFNFIKKLLNPSVEARIVHNDDNWWSVSINKYPHKLESKRSLAILFEEEQDNNSDILDNIQIDYEKTQLLKSIVHRFKDNYRLENMANDAKDFDSYVQEIDLTRAIWFNN